MSTSDEDGAGASERQVEAFLHTLRRSAEIAQELLRTTAQQNERIRSLEAELGSAREQVRFLERETSQLRGSLAAPRPPREPQLQQLIEEQNCLAHLFVSSDRLARAPTVTDTLDVAIEIMHNLVGADIYGLFLRWSAGDPVMVAPRAGGSKRDLGPHLPLVIAALESGRWVRKPGAGPEQLPVSVPLRLDGAVVGAVLVVELIPHIDGLGRLQSDLLALLSDRLATGLCLGALQSQAAPGEVWSTVRTALARENPDGRGPES